MYQVKRCAAMLKMPGIPLVSDEAVSLQHVRHPNGAR